MSEAPKAQRKMTYEEFFEARLKKHRDARADTVNALSEKDAKGWLWESKRQLDELTESIFVRGIKPSDTYLNPRCDEMTEANYIYGVFIEGLWEKFDKMSRQLERLEEAKEIIEETKHHVSEETKETLDDVLKLLKEPPNVDPIVLILKDLKMI